MNVIVKGINDVKSYYEEDEFIQEYFCTNKLTFGVSELLPGKSGGLDPGHKEADEVFYCAQGKVLCYFPDEDKYYKFGKGEALLIPQGYAHKLFNKGRAKAIVIWCCAPHP